MRLELTQNLSITIHNTSVILENATVAMHVQRIGKLSMMGKK